MIRGQHHQYSSGKLTESEAYYSDTSNLDLEYESDDSDSVSDTVNSHNHDRNYTHIENGKNYANNDRSIEDSATEPDYNVSVNTSDFFKVRESIKGNNNLRSPQDAKPATTILISLANSNNNRQELIQPTMNNINNNKQKQQEKTPGYNNLNRNFKLSDEPSSIQSKSQSTPMSNSNSNNNGSNFGLSRSVKINNGSNVRKIARQFEDTHDNVADQRMTNGRTPDPMIIDDDDYDDDEEGHNEGGEGEEMDETSPSLRKARLFNNSYDEKIKELNNENEKLKRLLGVKEDENRMLSHQCKIFTDEVNELRLKFEEVENERDSIVRTNDSLELKMSELNELRKNEVDQLKNELLEIEIRYSEEFNTFKSDKDLKQLTIKGLEETIKVNEESSQATISKLQEAVELNGESSRSKIKELEETIRIDKEVSQSTIRQLHETIKTNEDASQTTIRELKNTIKKNEESSETIINGLKETIKSDIASSQSIINDLERTIENNKTSYQLKIKELEETIKSDKESIEKSSKSHHESISTYTKIVDDMTESITSYMKTISDLSNTVENLKTSKKKALNESNNKLNEQIKLNKINTNKLMKLNGDENERLNSDNLAKYDLLQLDDIDKLSHVEVTNTLKQILNLFVLKYESLKPFLEFVALGLKGYEEFVENVHLLLYKTGISNDCKIIYNLDKVNLKNSLMLRECLKKMLINLEERLQ